MTALRKYQRLEAPGLWQSAPEARRLDVAVSIGDATLTLADMSGRPLAHWSLPAVRRLNPGARPALYSPSAAMDEAETLEIAEPLMIEAIETVRRAIERSHPRKGRLRLAVTTAAAALMLAAAAVWLPSALTRHTLSVLPDAVRASVGMHLLERIERVAGAPCGDKLGQAALDRLAARVAGAAETLKVRVLASGIDGARHLPGKIVLLDRAQVEDYEQPDVAAGFILAEVQRASDRDPMAPLLDHAGPLATARLLTTGELPGGVLDSYGEAVFAQAPAAIAREPLLERFSAAGVRITPYALALDQTGETTLGLIEADRISAEEAVPLLPPEDWARLQAICTR
ncbi:MAG: hypothetical protein CSA74_04205 [Rhodobacterales bacterium]|nr:MAG: hypothetical protein CSA74_04205 [Rhodobacterales bacterium]